MFSPATIATVALSYVALLFAIAYAGDRFSKRLNNRRLSAVIYSLSLAVYCTSWTFFGAVGSAVTDGWLFVTIYLGPILVFLFAHGMMRRMLALTQRLRLTSIADFIAYRYGKSRLIAVMVTITAVLGAVPYFALQLNAITSGLVLMSEPGNAISESAIAFLLALALGVFAVLFGARRLEASEHHRGMVLAVAFESLIKLVAFIALGLWALFALLDGPVGMLDRIAETPRYQSLFAEWSLPQGFWVQTLLAAAAILCLPRQFQVAFVENNNPNDLVSARWLFPVYLLLFAVLVIPIAIAGMETFGIDAGNGDQFVLSLPMLAERPGLTLLAFIGGFSAATGMVIVATVALATMVSNDLIMPLLLKFKRASERSTDGSSYNFDRVLLNSRRATIMVLVLIGWLYYLLIDQTETLAAIGLVSFAAAAQFAPALVLGLYWRAASREGALAGLLVGLIGWLVLIVLPALEVNTPNVLQMNIHQASLVTLGLNTLVLVLVSLWSRRYRPLPSRLLVAGDQRVTIGQLRRFAAGFVGQRRVDKAFAGALQPVEDLDALNDAPAGSELIGFTERLLSGCIGASSARAVLTAGLQRSGLNQPQAQALLEQTSSAIQFNRDLLEATLDHISQGVSVVDADLRLVSWNQAYIDLFEYPPNMIYVGRPVEELIRYNLERGLGGDGDVEEGVSKRMHHMRRGLPYVFERRHGNGRVLEMRGNPMPQKGYVTTYSDVTGYKQSESELKRAYATMEQQVQDRTFELQSAIQALEAAKAEAEQANRSKSRFLAAASHDLLQPLNAARLFASTLKQNSDRLDDESSALVRRVDHSLNVAEELLSSLLDISRLDQGALQPQSANFSLDQLFETLERQFADLARRRGLDLRVRRSGLTVHSDMKLVQRVLFNLVSNAMRYTRAGGVLVGCRRRGHHVWIEVRDTGPGIAPEEQDRIFEEFQRLDEANHSDGEFDSGLGLGLSICHRICHMLEIPLMLHSTVGKGSLFRVRLALAESSLEPVMSGQPATASRSDLAGLRILCIDDDRDILDGMHLLLQRWRCRVFTAENRDEALARVDQHFDLLLADYHLAGDNGLAVIEAFRAATPNPPPVLILTADRSDELGQRIEELGYLRLTKPVKPAALRALIRHVLDRPE